MAEWDLDGVFPETIMLDVMQMSYLICKTYAQVCAIF